MIKRFFVLSLICCMGLQLMAQTEETPYTGNEKKEKETKPVVFRDRLIMDIYHTFWMNMPTEVTHLKFDPSMLEWCASNALLVMFMYAPTLVWLADS